MQTVLIITKPPFGVLRFANLRYQDWYQILAKVAEHQSHTDCDVVIPTAVELTGQEPELATFTQYAGAMNIQNLQTFDAGVARIPKYSLLNVNVHMQMRWLLRVPRCILSECGGLQKERDSRLMGGLLHGVCHVWRTFSSIHC